MSALAHFPPPEVGTVPVAVEVRADHYETLDVIAGRNGWSVERLLEHYIMRAVEREGERENLRKWKDRGSERAEP